MPTDNILSPHRSVDVWLSKLNRRTSYLLLIAFTLVLGAADGIIRATYGMPTILGEEDLFKTFQGYSRGQSKHIARRAAKLAGDQNMEVQTADIWGNNQKGLFQHQSIGGICTKITDCKFDLVCRDGVCSSCLSSDECRERDPKRQCFNNTKNPDAFSTVIVDHPVCRHKPLIEAFEDADWWIAFITWAVTTLSAPTGTGGGGILVPMYIVLGGFTTHSAIPLSKATIFGGAVINNLINIPRRHPFANRPLIGYDLVYIMGPAILTGAVIGVLFNGISPGWLLGVLLTAVLAYSTWTTARKSWDIYLAETRADATEGERQRLLPGGGGALPGQHYSFSQDSASSDRLKDILEAEKQHDPTAIGTLSFAWIVITAIAMLKANCLPFQPIFVPCGGVLYWLIALIPLPVFAWFTWIAGNQMADAHEEKVAWGYRFSEGDMQWTRFNVRLYPFLAFLAGITAGSLGIAAGMLLAPFFLELGAIPLVSMATTSFFVMFTSSSTTIQYIFLNQLKLDYALFFCVVGGIGAAFGNVVLNAIVDRYKRAWFLVAIMSFLLFISMFLMSWMAWVDYAHEVAEAGYSFGFRDICEAET